MSRISKQHEKDLTAIYSELANCPPEEEQHLINASLHCQHAYLMRYANEIRNARIVTGIIYGYPPCCIEHFINRLMETESNIDTMGQSSHPEIEGMWFNGTGYIACPTCRQLPKEDVLHGIHRRRSIKTRFPRNYGERLAIKKLKRLEMRAEYMPFSNHVMDYFSNPRV